MSVMHGAPLPSMPIALLQRHAERIPLGSRLRALGETCMHVWVHGSKTATAARSNVRVCLILGAHQKSTSTRNARLNEASKNQMRVTGHEAILPTH
jgi:hypothetical protein